MNRFKWKFVPVRIKGDFQMSEEKQLDMLLQKCESTLNSLELFDEFGQPTPILPSVVSVSFVSSTLAVLVIGYTADQFYTEDMHG